MDALEQLVELLKAGGPYAMSAIFLLGWWIERRDRKEKEEHLRVVYERIIDLVEQNTRANDKIQAAMSALKEAITAMNGRLIASRGP